MAEESKSDFIQPPITQISEESTDTDTERNASPLGKKDKLNQGVHWYYAPAFLLFWLAIFFAVVYPIFFYLPEGLRIADESEHTCRFIAERAHRILIDYEAIGEKVIGSFANENITVGLILREIDKVRETMNHELYELELDIQIASGAYLHWHMINMYQGIQNIVVKLSPKNSTSQSYLLLNSHFDSKAGSPGTGDDGGMLVVMLETLRVLSSSKCSDFTHPIVFLFNGAEETPLEGSHAFITQHKWAKNCKAVINLDCAGSGHREILFQGGPNHPWLMKYYGKHVNRPFATSLAEEIFESGLIPSDTDFRIFKNFGKIPGLDLVHSYNGYVYHTEFDKLDVIPIGTLQITGDHILSLTHGLANAPELEDPSKHEKGHTIFYDFLGQFFLYYTERDAIIINTIVSVAAIALVAISLWMFSKQGHLPIPQILRSFGIVFILHFLGFLLAFGLPLLIAVFYDLDDRPMTWFTHKWLMIGQYVCPSLFGLCMPTLVYMTFQKRKYEMPRSYRVQMALQSHSIILVILCIVMTIMGIRTTYMVMMSIFFYDLFLIFNLATSFQSRGYWWVIPLLVSQIMPFLYFTYLIHAMLCTVTPMMGRFGSDTNPDLYIALLCALGTILSMGFIIPTLSIFRRPRSVLLSLIVITFIFTMISVSSVGFPYRPKTNVGRVNFLHVRRTFYGFDGNIEKSDSGYYFDFQDRRLHKPSEGQIDWSELRGVADDCEKELMCGVPLFNHRWYKARNEGMWLPSSTPIEIPGTSTLTLVRKTINATTSTARFEFVLSGPTQRSIFMRPVDGGQLTDWSFLRDVLESPDKWKPPYHIFFSCGIDNSPLEFYFEIEKTNGRFDVPSLEVGISGHYVSSVYPRGDAGDKFKKSFPNYIHCMEWPSSYERYVF